MIIGNRTFDVKNRTYIMGILNVTPDSFSDGGTHNQLEDALFHAKKMVDEGCDIIDVGGESTRPGYTLLSDEEEISRVLPVIERIKREFDVPVSLDTYKSKVAKAGIAAGADLINDIWGLKYDADMARVISDAKVACCLMHNKKEPVYDNFVADVQSELAACVALAKEAGIADDKIMLDPGVGFGKTYEHNLKAIWQMGSLHALGYPLLLGTSRKSVIGLTLDLPVSQREEGTLVTTVLAVMEHVAFVRVHDVLKNKRAIKMAEALRDCE